jgi:hypothetical protein
LPIELDGLSVETDLPIVTTKVWNEAGSIELWGSPYLSDIYDALIAAGWTETSAIPAVGYVLVSKTAPVRGAVTTPVSVNCTTRPATLYYDQTTVFPTSATTKIIGYDPNRELTPACPSYAYGVTSLDTIDNLIAAIGAYTPFTATLEPDYSASAHRLVLTAAAAGPQWNNYGFYASGWTFALTPPAGGGYTLESASYRGKTLTAELTEIGITSIFRVQIRFLSSSGGTYYTQHLETRQQYSQFFRNITTYRRQYRIIASPRQFAIYPAGSAFDGSETALLASVPWQPDDAPVQSAFVIGHALLSQAASGLRLTLAPLFGAMSLEGGLELVENRALQFGTARAFPGFKLTTVDDFTLVHAAYVYGRAAGAAREDGRIIGKLWNAIISLDAFPLSTEFGMIAGARFAHIGSQVGGLDSWVRASLWLACPSDG